MNTIFRDASLEDAEAIASFSSQAFVTAFGDLYKPQDLQNFLSAERSAATYRDKLQDPAVRVRLAEEDGQILAYGLTVRDFLFDKHPQPRPARSLFLSQLYCAKETTGRGLGAQLMEWVIQDAQDYGAEAVSLSVFSENFGAQRFYQRHGFAKIADIEFWVGETCDHEFLYELRF